MTLWIFVNKISKSEKLNQNQSILGGIRTDIIPKWDLDHYIRRMESNRKSNGSMKIAYIQVYTKKYKLY